MKISAAAYGAARPQTGGRLAAASLSVIAMLILQSPATGTAEAELACPYAQIVFARGTFEQPGVGATGQAFVDALSDRLGGKSVHVYAANYPASLDFKHAAQGIVDVRHKVESIAAHRPSSLAIPTCPGRSSSACPATQFVLPAALIAQRTAPIRTMGWP